MGLGVDDLLKNRRDEILHIAAKHGVFNVRVFGSVARAQADSESDIDFLVDGLENCSWGGGGLLIDLQELLGRRVDVVSPEDLHWYIREKVLKEAVRL